ncbi:MAG TPA: hypothetical protein VJ969_09525 [Desulfopila sp.]|nr:hypothetical protein [Desulfopila sp.]
MKTKEEFIAMLHAQIDEWNDEIDRLSAKAAQVEAQSRQEYYAQLAELKSKRAQLEEKLEKVQRSGEEAWKDLRSGIELTLDTMAETLKSVVSRFK